MASGVTTSHPVPAELLTYQEDVNASALVSYQRLEQSQPPPAPQPSTAWQTPPDLFHTSHGSHASLIFNWSAGTSQHAGDVSLTSQHEASLTSQRLVFPTDGPSYLYTYVNETYANDTYGNVSFGYDVTTNGTVAPAGEDALHWVRLVSLEALLFGLSLLTFIGNAMVLHAVRTERRLQSVSLDLIFNLILSSLG